MNRVLIALLLLLAATPATATEVSDVDLQPYLAVSSKQLYSTIIPPSTETTEDQQRFITRGGAAFSTYALRSDHNNTSVTQIYRGVATPPQLTELRDRLNAARIRGQRSCEIASDSTDARYDFTWYSPHGRRNSFAIVLGRRGASGLPPCRNTAWEVIQAVSDFEFEILNNPDTEILQSPP